MIIDTHAHLDFPEYETDLFAVLHNAKDVGIEHIINVGIDLESSKRTIELVNKVNNETGLPKIHASVGIHPNHATNTTEKEFYDLKELSNHEKVIALGETGLDYYRTHSNHADQKGLFKKHIELAIESHLPVIVHNREADDDCLKIIQDYSHHDIKGVVHCFSSDNDCAKKFLDLGFYISFTGNITFPKADKLRDTVKFIPTDRLLIETDSPFLAPQAKRGKRNEPAFLQHIIPFFADCCSLSNDDIARITSLNANELFGIGGARSAKDTIAYTIRNSLYLNITNKCTNDCFFCTRNTNPYVKGHYLKLNKEPTVEELIDSIGNPSAYDEVVFCGFGEPTERLDVLKTVAKHLKDKGVNVRLDTNGLGDLINNRPICKELTGLIDNICISLNSNLKDQYKKMCNPSFGDKAYPALLSFIKDAKRVIPNVLVSVVDLPDVDVEACRNIAKDLDVSFRLRKYDDTGFKND
ncbi:MAG: YchF/TatD family DNA exonuclease [Candidatus Anammoxibacter sp.]